MEQSENNMTCIVLAAENKYTRRTHIQAPYIKRGAWVNATMCKRRVWETFISACAGEKVKYPHVLQTLCPVRAPTIFHTHSLLRNSPIRCLGYLTFKQRHCARALFWKQALSNGIFHDCWKQIKKKQCVVLFMWREDVKINSSAAIYFSPNCAGANKNLQYTEELPRRHINNKYLIAQRRKAKLCFFFSIRNDKTSQLRSVDAI